MVSFRLLRYQTLASIWEISEQYFYEFINLELFEINLQNKFNVLTAESGMAGLELLTENPDIKVIISDMKMPIMNGIEFLKRVRGRNPNISCFILTGYGLTTDIEESIKDGLIIDCLRKPFEMNKIESVINEAIEE